MKITFRTLCALLLASQVIAGCLGDNDDSLGTTYSDVAITQFTLGTLNRYTATTSATTGNDTVVKTTVAGSTYPMTIDQLGHQIYNRTALPVGTDVKHVLCTISTRNGGVVALQSMTSDSLAWFQSTDSVDFSVPRTFRVYAIDGSAYRDYTVTVAASATQGIDFGWQLADSISDVAADARLVGWGDTVRVAASGIVTRGPQAWRVGADGYVEYSINLTQWDRAFGITYEAPGLRQLIGASEAELYALADDGRLLVSRDPYGAAWAEERLDDDAQLLPDADVAVVSWPYSPLDNTDYVLMAGTNTRLNGTPATMASVWRKLSSNTATGPQAGQWVYMPLDDANRQQLPATARLSLVRYEGVVLAVGSDLVVRQSRDEGITWPVASTYALPSAVDGAEWVSMAADGLGRLWLLTSTGQLWQGARR